MANYFDNRLRRAWEFGPTLVHLSVAGLLLWTWPVGREPAWPLPPDLARQFGWAFAALGIWRAWEGWRIVSYRRRLRRLPRFSAAARYLPWSQQGLYLGRGFEWGQHHVQRLVEARDPKVRRLLEPGRLYRLARQFERTSERASEATHWLRWLRDGTQAQRWWNPVRPLPDVGGDGLLHGVGLEDEHPLWMNLKARQGHMLVLGTTGVGKTRLAELLVTQDIRRGDCVIVIDPKGDLDLLFRMWAEAVRADKLDKLHIVHLGFPEISERYNPTGRFNRITEVATRIANQLPGEGNSAAFREFAWRFVNTVSRALVALGGKPDYRAIPRYVTDVDPLLIDYFEHWLDRNAPADWRTTVTQAERDPEWAKRLPRQHQGRDRHAAALVWYYREHGYYDDVCEGLKGIFDHDKSHYDKLTGNLLPLMQKLTTGKVGQLLAPNYGDAADKRPILEWDKVIRGQEIVYVGLDALTDSEVADAVGATMLADLTSMAGHLYKHGAFGGLPTVSGNRQTPPIVNLHTDELSRIVGPEYVPLLNMARGAGFRVTSYTQSKKDLEAGLGSVAKAGQLLDNWNNIIAMRVRTEETAKLITDQLVSARVFTRIDESRETDNNDPSNPVDFQAQNATRVSEQPKAELLSPADLIRLPVGQAFAMIDGGRLYKVRLPMAERDPLEPKGLKDIGARLRERWGTAA
ncbi:MAG: type IV conjugative transfer system coupling protein TraD [Chromatiales bacterium]|nr:type IV conjugative transfer system coupling protein TraD [Chromatiales bacterium]